MDAFVDPYSLGYGGGDDCFFASEDEAVKTWRSGGYQSGVNWEPGDLYRVDFNRNAMLDCKVDLEALARELGVLADYEAIMEV